jgi:hypothetical protein
MMRMAGIITGATGINFSKGNRAWFAALQTRALPFTRRENCLDAKSPPFKFAKDKQTRSKPKKTVMKFHGKISTGLALLSAVLLVTGCATSHTSPYQPGPVAGQAVGNGVGLVAGNIAGFGVGATEGTLHGFAAPFNPDYHMVRYWRTETTPDGRTIQVPYDILVDQYGRPAHMPAPTGNSAPPPPVTPMTTTNSPSK